MQRHGDRVRATKRAFTQVTGPFAFHGLCLFFYRTAGIPSELQSSAIGRRVLG